MTELRRCCQTLTSARHAPTCPCGRCTCTFAADDPACPLHEGQGSVPARSPSRSDDAHARETDPYRAHCTDGGRVVVGRPGPLGLEFICEVVAGQTADMLASADRIAAGLNLLHATEAGTAGVAASLGEYHLVDGVLYLGPLAEPVAHIDLHPLLTGAGWESPTVVGTLKAQFDTAMADRYKAERDSWEKRALHAEADLEVAQAANRTFIAEAAKLRGHLTEALTGQGEETGLPEKPDRYAWSTEPVTVDLDGVTSAAQASRLAAAHAARLAEGRHDRGWPTNSAVSARVAGEAAATCRAPTRVVLHRPYRAEGHNVLTRSGLMVACCGAGAIGALADRKLGNMAHVIADALNAVTLTEPDQGGADFEKRRSVGGEWHYHAASEREKGKGLPPFMLKVTGRDHAELREALADAFKMLPDLGDPEPVPALAVNVAGGQLPLGTLVAMVTAQVERALSRRPGRDRRL